MCPRRLLRTARIANVRSCSAVEVCTGEGAARWLAETGSVWAGLRVQGRVGRHDATRPLDPHLGAHSKHYLDTNSRHEPTADFVFNASHLIFLASPRTGKTQLRRGFPAIPRSTRLRTRLAKQAAEKCTDTASR